MEGTPDLASSQTLKTRFGPDLTKFNRLVYVNHDLIS